MHRLLLLRPAFSLPTLRHAYPARVLQSGIIWCALQSASIIDRFLIASAFAALGFFGSWHDTIAWVASMISPPWFEIEFHTKFHATHYFHFICTTHTILILSNVYTPQNATIISWFENATFNDHHWPSYCSFHFIYLWEYMLQVIILLISGADSYFHEFHCLRILTMIARSIILLITDEYLGISALARRR
jgi:hypothetical protein